MPTRICRWVTDHPIAFALIFFAFYFTGFFTLEQLITEPVYLIHCTLDDWIPFNEWFIFAYGSWFFLIPWALITLLRRDRSNYFNLPAAISAVPKWAEPASANHPHQQSGSVAGANHLVDGYLDQRLSLHPCCQHLCHSVCCVAQPHLASPQTGSRRMYPSHCAHLPFHPVFKATLGRRRPLWYCADRAAASGCHAALQKVFPL